MIKYSIFTLKRLIIHCTRSPLQILTSLINSVHILKLPFEPVMKFLQNVFH